MAATWDSAQPIKYSVIAKINGEQTVEMPYGTNVTAIGAASAVSRLLADYEMPDVEFMVELLEITVRKD